MFHRRGACSTLDAIGLRRFVASLRCEGATSLLLFLTFSHGLKDPVAIGGLIFAQIRSFHGLQDL